MSQENPKAPDQEAFWGSYLEGHYRARWRYLSLPYEREFLIDKWLHFKKAIADRWFLPWWTPLFFFMTHVAQRNRNLYLVENRLNYRPWKYRYNDRAIKKEINLY